MRCRAKQEEEDTPPEQEAGEKGEITAGDDRDDATIALQEWDESNCLTPKGASLWACDWLLHCGDERFPGSEDRMGAGRECDGCDCLICGV